MGDLPHFVLDFLYMLTICAKICLGITFQVIASKVEWFLRYTAFSPKGGPNFVLHYFGAKFGNLYLSNGGRCGHETVCAY